MKSETEKPKSETSPENKAPSETPKTPEIKASPEEMPAEEKRKIVIAFNLKKEFVNASPKEIGGAIYRYLKSNKKDEERWMEKYSPVLEMPADAKWADWKGKVTPLLLKDLRLPPGSSEEAIKQKEQENWLEENWSTPQDRDKVLKTYSHLGDKRRAWLNNPHYYIEDWKEIDKKVIKEAFQKAYSGEAEKEMEKMRKAGKLSDPDGHLTEEGLKDIVPRAFAFRGTDLEAREERMSDAVDAEGKSFASKRLFEQLKRGEITRVATGALDEDAKTALYFITKLNKLGGNIKSVVELKNGEWMRDAINLDTGNRDAGLTGEGFKTYFFDHHQEERTIPTSAVEGVYRFLVEHDLIPGDSPAEVETNKKWMANLVKFVNEVDNFSFDRSSFNAEFYKGDFRNSLYGLRRYMSIDDLIAIFQKGGPDFNYQKYRLSDADARTMTGTYFKKDPITGQDETFTGSLEEIMKFSQKDIDSSIDAVKEAEEFMKRNKISQTHHYLGSVMVYLNKPKKYELGGPDINQTRQFESQNPIHNEAPYAYGYETTITFSASKRKVRIQSIHDLGPIHERLKSLGDKDVRLENIRGQMILTLDNKGGAAEAAGQEDSEEGNLKRLIGTLQRLGLWDTNADFFKTHDRNKETALNEVVRDTAGNPISNPTTLQVENAFRTLLALPPEKAALFEQIDLDELQTHSLLASNLKEAIELNAQGGEQKFKIALDDTNREYRKDVYVPILAKNLKTLGIKARLNFAKPDSIEVIINAKSAVESLDEAGQKALTKYALENGLMDLLESGKELSWAEIISMEVDKLGLPEAVKKLDGPDALALIRKGKDQAREAEDYGITLKEFLSAGLDKEPYKSVKRTLLRAIHTGSARADGNTSVLDIKNASTYLTKLGYSYNLAPGAQAITKVERRSEKAAEGPKDANARYIEQLAGIVGLSEKTPIGDIDKEIAKRLNVKPARLVTQNRPMFTDRPKEWIKELFEEAKNPEGFVIEYDDKIKEKWKKDILEALDVI